MDRRQRKTRQAIYDAFDELLRREPYSAITVAEIIEEADIGRSTFYAHFETKDQLLSEMCHELFHHVFEGVDYHCVTHATLETPDTEGRLAHLLYHLRDTRGAICGKLLKEREPQFTAFFQSRLADLFDLEPLVAADGMPAELKRGILVSAFCESVIWWFENDMPCTPEQLAHWFCETVS